MLNNVLNGGLTKRQVLPLAGDVKIGELAKEISVIDNGVDVPVLDDVPNEAL